MIDNVLDFALDHSAVFAILLVAFVVSLALAAAWGYGRYHERATRRRGVQLIG